MILARNLGLHTAILVGMLVACVVVSASSQVLLEPVSQDPSISPPGFVTLVFRITNTGPTVDTFDLSTTVPSGWTTLAFTPSLSLQPSEYETVLLALRIPAGVLAAEYTVVLHATSQTDLSNQDKVTLLVHIDPVIGVRLLPVVGRGVVLPGGTAEYLIEVLNQGNTLAQFGFEARSRWPSEVIPNLVTLSPGERITIVVHHWAPADADPGRECSLTVAVHSVLETGVIDQVTIMTKILPLPPQEVSRSLMEKLPVSLRLSMEHDLISRVLDSALRLSLTGGVEDGYFSTYLNASPLFGPTPLEIESFSISYRRAPARYVIGDISNNLTDLLSLSCRGGSVIIDAEHYALTFLGGGSDSETRVGGRLSLGPSQVGIGIAYLERKDETNQEAVWSLTASAEPLENWSLRMEGALGIENAFTSRAFFFNTTIDTVGYFLSAEAFSVGTYFPGSHRDQAGLSLSQRLRHEDLFLSASFCHDWDNVIGDPFSPTTVHDELNVNLAGPFAEWLVIDTTLECTWVQSESPAKRSEGLLEANVHLSPFEEGWPTINPSVELTWERSEGSSGTSKIGHLLSLGVGGSREALSYSFLVKADSQIDRVAGIRDRTGTLSLNGSVGSLPYSFSTNVRDQIDHVTETHYRTLTFSEGVGLSIEEFYMFLTLTQTRVEDYVTRQVVAGGADVSLNFRPQGSQHSVDITLVNAGDDFDLLLNFDLHILDSLNLQVEGGLKWHRSDAIAPAFSGKVALAFNLNLTFDLLIPFIVTKGQLEGHAFVDINANGQYDTGETGIPDLLLTLTGTQALSGAQGEFLFTPLPPGDYSLRILNLPWDYVPLGSMPISVRLEAGVVEQVELPVVKGSMITGRVAVFSEEQREGLFLEGSGREPSAYGEGLSNVSLRLTSDEETFLQVTDRDGHFQFDRLRPGHWILEVYSDQLPQFHRLEKDVFESDLKQGEQADILVKVFVKQRPIQLIDEGELQVEEVYATLGK